jgi:hypothetical protein
MLFPDEDPFAPTVEEKRDALGVMAAILGGLVLAVLALDILDIELPTSAMQSIIAFALVVVVMGPKHVAWFVNVLRFLRNGWR